MAETEGRTPVGLLVVFWAHRLAFKVPLSFLASPISLFAPATTLPPAPQAAPMSPCPQAAALLQIFGVAVPLAWTGLAPSAPPPTGSAGGHFIHLAPWPGALVS